ncbi:(d)CMP kinase [Limnovirga soli]|uniref:Cytidylate kinase n=1 Tax=Limnovirga soli TaxID=2656915 RepID=A0A8J8FDV8_9BACT|nr:(d)CMP kinase [Limnovirga soli]NNV55692.1 (d)CMP kinase [Limnovirga soli]
MKKIIITIDGYSSCGKSTVARQLAKELNYIFIDSGAMYRAITLYFLQNKVNLHDEAAVNTALAAINLSFVFNATTGKSDMYLNEVNVEIAIREMYISDNVSTVAADAAVREFAVAQQRKIGEQKGIVMDGRDIGTTVFPNAELKIFMTADIDVRVERRYKEVVAANAGITREEVKQNLAMRDHLDSTRAISPLRKADDALVLDNSNLTMAEQLTLVLQWVNERIQ